MVYKLTDVTNEVVYVSCRPAKTPPAASQETRLNDTQEGKEASKDVLQLSSSVAKCFSSYCVSQSQHRIENRVVD